MRVPVAVFTALLFAGNAQAGPLDDCNSNDMNRRISGCTTALKSLKLDKTNKAIAYALRGDAHFRAGNDVAALADFDACLALRPKNTSCRDGKNRIRCTTTDHKDPSATETNCGFLKSSPDKRDHVFFYTFLAQSQASDIRDPAMLAKAIDNFNKAIAIGAPSGMISAADYNFRGMLHLENKVEPGGVFCKEPQKALDDFNMAIAMEPNVARYHLHRGYVHNQLIKPEAAWADFQKARELDPSDPAIQTAYEKQRVITPEGQAEIRKRLDDALGGKQ